MIEHKYDIETALLFGAQGTDSSGAQYTEGAVSFITSYGNIFDGSGIGGTGTKSTGHNTTAGGFAGTDFNNGKGYANTIYSHCNFLAGKKIKLYQKILSAIEDVDSLYTNIKSKRSEYYEYNQ